MAPLSACRGEPVLIVQTRNVCVCPSRVGVAALQRDMTRLPIEWRHMSATAEHLPQSVIDMRGIASLQAALFALESSEVKSHGTEIFKERFIRRQTCDAKAPERHPQERSQRQEG